MSTLPPPPDQDARTRIETELGTTFLVEAGAGSGKTTALVSRLERLLVSGKVSIDQVCAITFTRKAAGELRLRLRERLEAVRADPAQGAAEAERATRALERLEGAAVGTIHGFAATILRERPVEADLDPGFRVEDESLARLETHCQDWLTLCVDRGDPLVRRYLVGHGGNLSSLFYTLRTLWEHRDLHALGPEDAGAAAWSRDAETPLLLDTIRTLAAEIRPVLDPTSRTFAKLEPLLNLGELLAREPATDLDRAEARLLALDYEVFGKTRLREADSWSVDPDDARALRERASELLEPLARYRRHANLDVVRQLVPRLSAVLCDPLDPDSAAAHLRRIGVLDSLGILLAARDLVQGDLAVRRAFQRRYPVLLVDELQDTDPLQVELIAFLSAPAYAGADWREALTHTEPGRLFLVGDPKQSIYRFRRADLGLYREIKRALGGCGEVLTLTSNFRCRPGLAQVVNAAFADILPRRPDHQPDYQRIEAQRPPSPSGQAPLVWLDLDCQPKAWSIRSTEPLAAAEFFARSLQLEGAPPPPEPLYVEDQHTKRERIAEPRDVAFLFRNFVSNKKDLTAAYVEALAKRNIPAVLFAGSSFRDREEVDATITALRAIERPDDRIAVYGALKGPFFAHPEPVLLGDDLGRPRLLDPRRPPDPSLPETLQASLELLGRLHQARNHVPTARTIQRLYDETRALATQASQPFGARRVANLVKIQRLARAFDAERGEATSFRAFTQRLQDLEDEGDSPLAEEGRGGVRFLSLHKAKGLEFPIVYLADPTTQSRKGIQIRRVYRRETDQVLVSIGDTPLPSAEVDFEINAEIAEGERLLYVATTRARDVLVVPRVLDYQDTKYDRLALRLVPHLQNTLRSNPTVIREATAKPNAPLPLEPAHTTTPAANPTTYADWKAARAAAHAAAGQPSQPVTSVTDLCKDDVGAGLTPAQPVAGSKPPPPPERPELADVPLFSDLPLFAHLEPKPKPPVPKPELEPRSEPEPNAIQFPGREDAKDFGTFVHWVLATVSLGADPETVRHTARTLARSSPEVLSHLDDACKQIDWTLAHPLLERARQAKVVYRELPISGLDADGQLVEGVVDLFFETEDGPVIVDYKTGEESPAHAKQLELYATLLGTPGAERWAIYSGQERARHSWSTRSDR